MCLSAMLLGGMGGDQGNFIQPLPPGSQSKKYQGIMWLVLLVHLALSITLMFALSVWTGIMQLIA